jgi:membrane protein YdbS with pleckstrin-like domain
VLNLIRRGPNAAGWACLIFFGVWSYDAGSPWPIVGFLAISIIPALILIWIDRRKT